MPKQTTPRILIAGAATGCWTNIGDQAVLIAMLADLSTAIPGAEITVVSSNPPGYLSRFGVKEIAHTNLPEIRRATRQSDLMILGGGSIFYDYWPIDAGAILTADHEGLAFFGGLALLAAAADIPLMIYGVGVGPLQTDSGRSLTRMTFELANVVTVRDADSLELLSSLGISNAKIEVCADPAFSLSADRNHSPSPLSSIVGRDLPRPIVGIALRSWDISVDSSAWEVEVSRALDEFIKLEGGSVVFMPFHKTVDWPLTDDKGLAERVRAGISSENAVILSDDRGPLETLSLFSEFDIVLAMRLHAAIFSVQAGVPLVALACDLKVSSFMNSVGGASYHLELENADAEGILSRLRLAYRDRDALRASFSSRSRAFYVLAQRNAAKAAELLRVPTNGGRVISKGSNDLLETLSTRGLLDGQLQAASNGTNSESTVTGPAAASVRSKEIESIKSEVSPRRRVAILTNRLLDWKTYEPRFGGGERYCFQLGNLLRRLDFDVDLYQVADEPFEREALGFRIIGLKRGASYSEFDYGVCDDFYEVSQSYDHVIYLAPNLASGRIREDALLICHGIWFDHNLYESFFSFRSPEWFAHVERVFRNPARIVSVDANSINVVRALWPDLAGRMVHVPNWVDNRAFNPPLTAREEPLTVLFPRRSDRLRGSGMLGEILSLIPHECKFLWVGTSNPEDDRRVEELAARDPRLTFQDASFEEMPDFYRRAEICVIPTIASEGTSLACLEGMASGCAVVATVVGGLPELIQSGVNGLLTSPEPNDIARAINHLIEQPRERLRLQRAALKTSIWFSLTVWEKKWVEVLEEQGWIKSATDEWIEQQRLETTLNEHLLNRELDAELTTEKTTQLGASETSEPGDGRPSNIIDSLERQLLEREREIQLLEAHLGERQRRIDDRENELVHRDQLRVAREADISRLRREQKFNRGVLQQLLQLSDTFLQKSVGSEELKEIERRTVDQESTLRTLSQTIEGLLQREGTRKIADERASAERLIEIERSLQHKIAQASEQERTIRARDEAIGWLKGEVENYLKISQGLAAANRILNEELAEKDAHLQILREAVQLADLELLGLKISRGWRLLNQFRKVRRGVRSITGGPIPHEEPAPRPTLLVDRREVEWHSTLAPLLEEVRARLAGLSAPASSPVAGGTGEPEMDTRTRIRLLPRPNESELRMMLDEEPIPQRRALPDVVCFSVIDWEFRYQRPQQIMSQFAANGHRVFYISTTRFTAAGSAPRVALKSIKDNVFEVELCCVQQPDVYGEVIGGVNQRELEESLEELRVRFSINDAISYVMIASWTSIALLTQERWGWRVIYDCMDEWDRFPGIKPAIVEAEQHLVDKCDLLVVSSLCLSRKWSAHAEKLRLARNAVDYNFYLSKLGPSHLLADATRPIVGYFGAIADWFDLELVAFLAEKRPEYTFVLLGGIFSVDVSELLNKPNVRLLGQHPYEMMPKYLYQFDVCIIPFRMNPITEATDPVKLYEYLSSGKPVVSVNLPELEPYRDHVYIAKDQDEFVEQLDRAIRDDDPELVAGRRALARANDWTNRYETIAEGLSARTRRVSVVIVTYNNLELTKICLESVIINTDYPNYEVIVVDNHSVDGTRSYLQFMSERLPNIRIILSSSNEGFARANNQGIALSSGDDIVLLNNDTIVPRGWLSRLVRHLRHDEVGLVGPVSNFVGNEARIEVSYETWEEMESFARDYTSRHDGQAADIHMLAMFCVAMRRDVYDDIGPLDEMFGVGMFEDDDYAHRARLKGYRVMCAADVFVHHFGQASFKKLIETGEYDALFARNLKTFESKWNVKWSARSNVPLEFKANYVREAASELSRGKSLASDAT